VVQTLRSAAAPVQALAE